MQALEKGACQSVSGNFDVLQLGLMRHISYLLAVCSFAGHPHCLPTGHEVAFLLISRWLETVALQVRSLSQNQTNKSFHFVLLMMLHRFLGCCIVCNGRHP